MLEQMEISESIYEGVVEPSYRNSIRADANSDGHNNQKRGVSASSHTYSVTSDSSVKLRKTC